jgi:HPt (histidine-containing phosphotransfer) domain-containing protein
MEPASEKHTSLEFLKTFTGNDAVRMRKYINMFLVAAPAEADIIRNSTTTEKHEALRAAAHGLRPQLTYMGIKKGEILLRQVEDYVMEQKQLEEIPALVKMFDEIFVAAVAELQEVVKQIN